MCRKLTARDRERLARVGSVIGNITILSYNSRRFKLLCDCGKPFERTAQQFELAPTMSCKSCSVAAFGQSGKVAHKNDISVRDNTPKEDQMIKDWLKVNK